MPFIHRDVRGDAAGAFPASCFCRNAACRASPGLSGSIGISGVCDCLEDSLDGILSSSGFEEFALELSRWNES